MPVRIISHHWLEDRRRHLEGQRDQSNLPEIQAIALFQERVNRREERLNRIVEQMRETDREEDPQCRRSCRRARLGIGSIHGGGIVRAIRARRRFSVLHRSERVNPISMGGIRSGASASGRRSAGRPAFRIADCQPATNHPLFLPVLPTHATFPFHTPADWQSAIRQTRLSAPRARWLRSTTRR